MSHLLLITQNLTVANEFKKIAAVTQAQLVVSTNPSKSEFLGTTRIFLDHEMAGMFNVDSLQDSQGQTCAPVVIVLAGAPNAQTWELAQQVQAEHIALLPESRDWLVNEMQPPSTKSAQIISFIPAVAGSGTSTVVGALAATWAKQGKTVAVVDCDSKSVGLDVAFGLDQTTGLRWSDLIEPGFNPDPMAFRDSLPSHDGIYLVSNNVPNLPELSGAVVKVVQLLSEACDVVLLDHGSHGLEIERDVHFELTHVVVMTNTLRACANAHALAKYFGDRQFVLAIREVPGADLAPLAISDSLDKPLWSVIPTESKIVEFVEQGLLLSGVNTSKYNRAVNSLAERLTNQERAVIAS